MRQTRDADPYRHTGEGRADESDAYAFLHKVAEATQQDSTCYPFFNMRMHWTPAAGTETQVARAGIMLSILP
jgi:hypothetical protein